MLLQLIIGAVVVGLVSVTGLAYFDTTRRIYDKQEQIDELTRRISNQDKTIEALASEVSEVASKIGDIEVCTTSK